MIEQRKGSKIQTQADRLSRVRSKFDQETDFKKYLEQKTKVNVPSLVDEEEFRKYYEFRDLEK